MLLRTILTLTVANPNANPKPKPKPKPNPQELSCCCAALNNLACASLRRKGHEYLKHSLQWADKV